MGRVCARYTLFYKQTGGGGILKIYISGKVTDNPDYFEQFNKAYACLVDEHPDA